MQPTVLVISSILMMIACAIVALVCRRNAVSSTRRYYQEQLDGVERRMLEALERLRTATEGTVRDGDQALIRSHGDLLLAVRGGIEASRVAMAGDVDSRSATLQQHLATALTEARREHTDRIERLEAAVTSAVATVSKSSDETKTALTEAARDHARTQLEASERLRNALSESLRALNETLTAGQHQAIKELGEARDLQAAALAAVRDEVRQDLAAVVDAQAQAATDLRDRLQRDLDAVRKDTEDKLERIRATVDERLQTTLENRLGESFRLVSERLEQVHHGLGEVQTLASGVGDLKRVLTNVRSRGIFGEVQLRALLDDVLTPAQYDENVATVAGSSERVEFAVKLPGRDGGEGIYLPIDSKFPSEDYQRLQDALEKADTEAVEDSRRALRRRALLAAETIRRKYIASPFTTEFAIMFLLTEGLYAEVLRIPGLHDEMLRVHRVVAVGPTTLQALLTSFQMGFRTLAIERRSAEVWNVLAAVKTEFAKFGMSLDAVGKKIHEAGNKIADVSKRSRAMERKLKAVEVLPQPEAGLKLPTSEGEHAPSPQQ